MSLSVVMPNFNHAKWLPRALSALLAQSTPPSEIIIVDDASTDNSISTIEELANEHTSIRLLRHETNLGAAAAIGTGFAAAQGEFVLFSAADDFVLPGLLQRAIAALCDHPEAALFCAGAVAIDPDGKILDFRPFTEPTSSAGYITPEEVRRLISFSDNWIIGATVVYRRARLLAAGGFDPALGSFCDGIVVRNLALRNGFYFDPDILAAFMVYPQSFSSSSALSPGKSQALINLVRERGTQVFPKDVCDCYSQLIARRLRFNMSRLCLLYSHRNADHAASVFGGSPLDQRILRMLARIPLVNRTGMLCWMFLRTRPFGLWSIIKSWLNHFGQDPSRRARVARHVTKMTATTNNSG